MDLRFALRPHDGADAAVASRSWDSGPPLAGRAGLVSRYAPSPDAQRLAAGLADVSVVFDPDRNPWGLLICAVGLTVGIRLLHSWQQAAESESAAVRSGRDAALLAGISPARADGRYLAAGALVRPLPPGRGLRGDRPDARPVFHPMERRTDHRAGNPDPG